MKVIRRAAGRDRADELRRLALNELAVPPVAGTLLIEGDHIVACGAIEVPGDTEKVDATGLIVAPGLVDLGVFRTDKPAFRFGGITRAALMPDQSSPLDDVGLIREATRTGKPDFWVHPIAAATRRLKGEELAEIGMMLMAIGSVVCVEARVTFLREVGVRVWPFGVAAIAMTGYSIVLGVALGFAGPEKSFARLNPALFQKLSAFF